MAQYGGFSRARVVLRRGKAHQRSHRCGREKGFEVVAERKAGRDARQPGAARNSTPAKPRRTGRRPPPPKRPPPHLHANVAAAFLLRRAASAGQQKARPAGEALKRQKWRGGRTMRAGRTALLRHPPPFLPPQACSFSGTPLFPNPECAMFRYANRKEMNAEQNVHPSSPQRRQVVMLSRC